MKCSDISSMYVCQYISELLVHAQKTFLKHNTDPFIENFKRNVPDRKINDYSSVIRNYYRNLMKDSTELNMPGPGAGSRYKENKLTVAGYARRTSVSSKRGHLLFKIASWYKPDVIIELGTSFGISTLHLQAGSPDSKIITVEGNPQVASLVASNFKLLGLKNVKLINDLFDNVIHDLIRESTSKSLVFIDGNHTFEHTVKYFKVFSKASLIVLDDIRWSEDMIRAWRNITGSADGYTLIDFFGIGIAVKGGTGKIYTLWP